VCGKYSMITHHVAAASSLTCSHDTARVASRCSFEWYGETSTRHCLQLPVAGRNAGMQLKAFTGIAACGRSRVQTGTCRQLELAIGR
jgi:hypothetical protein